MWYPRKPSTGHEGKLDPLGDALGELPEKKPPAAKAKQKPRDLNAEVNKMESETAAVLSLCQERLTQRDEQAEALQLQMEQMRGESEVFEYHMHGAIAEKNKKGALENTLKQKIQELKVSNTKLEQEQKAQQADSEKLIDELQKRVRSLEDRLGAFGVRAAELQENLQRRKEHSAREVGAAQVKAQEEEKRRLELYERLEEKSRQEKEKTAAALQVKEQLLKEQAEELESLRRQLSKHEQLVRHKEKLERQQLLEQQKHSQLHEELHRLAADRDQHAQRLPREREEAAKLAGAFQARKTVLSAQLKILQKKFQEQDEFIASRKQESLLDLPLEEAIAEMDRMRARDRGESENQESSADPRPEIRT